MVADLVKLEVHDRIDQLAHHHFSIAARRQAKRRNDRNASSASTSAICGIQQLTTAPACHRTPAFTTGCLSMSC